MREVKCEGTAYEVSISSQIHSDNPSTKCDVAVSRSAYAMVAKPSLRSIAVWISINSFSMTGTNCRGMWRAMQR